MPSLYVKILQSPLLWTAKVKLVLYSYDFKLDPGSYDFKVMIIILENNGCEVNITEKMYK